eukprot:gene44257-59036_t
MAGLARPRARLGTALSADTARRLAECSAGCAGEAEGSGRILEEAALPPPGRIRARVRRAMTRRVTLYTDGACSGNPGPGGWGVVLLFGEHRKDLCGGEPLTTNNRMELMAVIVALEALTKEGLDIDIYTDSKYVCDAVEKGWLWGWIKKGFKDKKNPDLWMRFANLYKKHTIRFNWVKGHAGHPENERCDRLATEAADNNAVLIDKGYLDGKS